MERVELPVTPPEPLPDGANPLKLAVGDALRSGRTVDAVRLFLRAVDNGTLPNSAALYQEARLVLGDTDFQHLLAALAAFPCPYCSNGFNPCSFCNGSGRSEGAFACTHCRTLGVVTCDCCGGSGAAAFSFFPRHFETPVAAMRVTLASRRLEAASVDSAAKVNLQPHIVVLPPMKRYLELTRVHSLFEGALDLLRSAGARHEPAIARLAARCWVGMARSELQMSDVLGQLQSKRSTITPDSPEQHFAEERARLLSEERAQLLARAQERMQHIHAHEKQRSTTQHDAIEARE